MRNTATLIRRVRDLATKYPQGLYIDDLPGSDEECSYTKGEVEHGPPTFGCLIGQAARNYIDIPPEADRNGIRSVLDALAGQGAIKGSEADWDWLEDVQEAQDSGRTWSVAVTEADMKAEDPE